MRTCRLASALTAVSAQRSAPVLTILAWQVQPGGMEPARRAGGHPGQGHSGSGDMCLACLASVLSTTLQLLACTDAQLLWMSGPQC